MDSGSSLWNAGMLDITAENIEDDQTSSRNLRSKHWNTINGTDFFGGSCENINHSNSRNGSVSRNGKINMYPPTSGMKDNYSLNSSDEYVYNVYDTLKTSFHCVTNKNGYKGESTSYFDNGGMDYSENVDINSKEDQNAVHTPIEYTGDNGNNASSPSEAERMTAPLVNFRDISQSAGNSEVHHLRPYAPQPKVDLCSNSLGQRNFGSKRRREDDVVQKYLQLHEDHVSNRKTQVGSQNWTFPTSHRTRRRSLRPDDHELSSLSFDKLFISSEPKRNDCSERNSENLTQSSYSLTKNNVNPNPVDSGSSASKLNSSKKYLSTKKLHVCFDPQALNNPIKRNPAKVTVPINHTTNGNTVNKQNKEDNQSNDGLNRRVWARGNDSVLKPTNGEMNTNYTTSSVSSPSCEMLTPLSTSPVVLSPISRSSSPISFASHLKISDRSNLYSRDFGPDTSHNDFWSCVAFEAGARKADVSHPGNYLRNKLNNKNFPRFDANLRLRVFYLTGIIVERSGKPMRSSIYPSSSQPIDSNIEHLSKSAKLAENVNIKGEKPSQRQNPQTQTVKDIRTDVQDWSLPYEGDLINVKSESKLTEYEEMQKRIGNATDFANCRPPLRPRTLSILGLSTSMFDRFMAKILCCPENAEYTAQQIAKVEPNWQNNISNLFYYLVAVVCLALADRHEEIVPTRYSTLTKTLTECILAQPNEIFAEPTEQLLRICKIDPSFKNINWKIAFRTLQPILIQIELCVLRNLEFLVSLPPCYDLVADILNPRTTNSQPSHKKNYYLHNSILQEAHLLLRLGIATTRIGLQFKPSVQALAAATIPLLTENDDYSNPMDNFEALRAIPEEAVRICQIRLIELYLRLSLLKYNSTKFHRFDCFNQLDRSQLKQLHSQLTTTGRLKPEETLLKKWLFECRDQSTSVDSLCQTMTTKYIGFLGKYKQADESYVLV